MCMASISLFAFTVLVCLFICCETFSVRCVLSSSLLTNKDDDDDDDDGCIA